MNRSRRGIALLLVLSTLVLVVPALALLASRSTSLHRSSRQTDLAAMIDGSMPTFEARIQTWLADEAAGIVLPIDAAAPSTDVDQLAWNEGSRRASVSITAFDLRGMLPVATVRDTPLGQRMLPERSAQIRDVPSEQAAALGLDGWSNRAVLTGEPSWYPPMAADERLGPQSGALIAFDLAELDLPAILNVNTAPWPIVESVARASGLSGVERLAEARKNGESPSVPAGAAIDRTGRQDSAREITLTSTSDAWAFRIDAASGPARRSWWLVYVQDQQGWRLSRRVPIDA